jgi:hypothetical protein
LWEQTFQKGEQIMNPIIEWLDIRNKRCLFLSFDKHFSSENAQSVINIIQPMIDEINGKFTMVWECSTMVGYDAGAREAWQVFIKKIKPKIESINLVSQNILIRTGAMVIGIFAGIKIVTWVSLDDFQKHT